MKKASEFIKLSATFSQLLHSFSMITVTLEPKKREQIFKRLRQTKGFASFIKKPEYYSTILTEELTLYTSFLLTKNLRSGCWRSLELYNEPKSLPTYNNTTKKFQRQKPKIFLKNQPPSLYFFNNSTTTF